MLQRVAPALDSKSLRPEDVLQFKAPIAGYLCPVEANTFGVEFLSFEIRDYDSGRTVYSVSEGLHSIGSRLRPRLPRSPDLVHVLACLSRHGVAPCVMDAHAITYQFTSNKGFHHRGSGNVL